MDYRNIRQDRVPTGVPTMAPGRVPTSIPPMGPGGAGAGVGPYYNQASLQRSLDLMKDSVQGERHDELFYDYLLKQTPDQSQREIITSIRDDERRHNRIFRRMYKDFTGEDITSPESVPFEQPKNYLDGLRQALFGELSAARKYRVIRQGLPTRPYRDQMFNIINDEMTHASKYNYLYTVNSTNMPNLVPLESRDSF